MSRLLPLVVLLPLAGCAATTVPVAGLRVPVAAAVGSQSLALTVVDARTEAEPAELGVRRITMGIPRGVEVADGAALAPALREAVAASLEAAGYALDPAGRALTITVHTLESDGYFGELSLTYDLQLELAEAPPARRTGKRVGAYKGAEGYAATVAEALTAILSDLLAARPLGPKASAPAACAGCRKPLEPAWVACPHCGRKR